MIEKYNAFISYRHSLEDNKIAKEVQTQLERFHIPHKIRKLTGKKRIERIFRDKEELPITSDLNEDIDYALGHSDYLIVLCSTHTSESIWVQKEIETFLINHTKKEILTVLVDGEPEDVIPEILTHDTVTRTLNDGSEITYEEVIEPLSCDYRLPIKQARKEELPRIAATIIGCSYDELMRRRRQYRIRRAAIVTAVAAAVSIGVMAYLTWSLTQIKTNYNKALTNQSENYAAQSELALEDNDKVKAIDMALKGLPSEDNPEMPVTDEAWKALSDALGVYYAPGLKVCDPVWKYEMESSIVDFIVSDDKQYLAAADSSNYIRVWEAGTHRLVTEICYPGEAILGFGYAGDHTFVVVSSNKITGYDTSDWEEAWTTELDFETDTFLYYTNRISSSPDSGVFTANFDDGVLIIDANDGKVIKKIKCADLDCIYFSDVRIRGDGSSVALVCPVDNDGFDISSEIYIYDIEKDKYTKLDETFYLVLSCRFTTDGDFAVLYIDDQESYSSRLGDTVVMAESTAYIKKFDHETGKTIWSAEDCYTTPTVSKRLVIMNYLEEDGSLTEVVVALYSDRCTVINSDTGEVIRTVELPAEFVSCYSAGDYTLLLILFNGQYCSIDLSYDDETAVASKYFDEKIIQSDLINATFGTVGFVTLRSGDNYLIEYNTRCYDDSFMEFSGLSDQTSVADYCSTGNYFITLDYNCTLRAVDVETGDLEWSSEIDAKDSYSAEIIGASADGEKIFLIDDGIYSDTNDFATELYSVDVDSGDMDLVYKCSKGNLKCFTMNDNAICIFACDSSNGYIYLYDIEKDDMTLYETDVILDGYITPELYLSPDSRYLLAVFKDNSFSTVLFGDLKKDDFELIEENAGSILSYAWNEDSSAYACGKTGMIIVSDLDNEEILTIDTNGRYPMAMQYYNDELLVVYSVGILARYAEDGTFISESKLDCYAINEYDPIYFLFGEDEFIVTVDCYSTVFSMETFKPRTFIYNLDAYVEDLDVFICHGYDGGESIYGSFENLSIEELIELGYDYITVEQDG